VAGGEGAEAAGGDDWQGGRGAAGPEAMRGLSAPAWKTSWIRTGPSGEGVIAVTSDSTYPETRVTPLEVGAALIKIY
jgi:hypothetical protein